jgi:hypothetical protein
LGARVILATMTDQVTGADEVPRPPRKRRRVFHTAGLTASAAVLALSLQAGAQSGDDDPPLSQYGDATILDPDATTGDVVDQ